MTNGREDFVDVKVLKDHLKVGKSFIYKLVMERRIPYYKVGGKFLFMRESRCS